MNQRQRRKLTTMLTCMILIIILAPHIPANSALSWRGVVSLLSMFGFIWASQAFEQEDDQKNQPVLWVLVEGVEKYSYDALLLQDKSRQNVLLFCQEKWLISSGPLRCLAFLVR